MLKKRGDLLSVDLIFVNGKVCMLRVFSVKHFCTCEKTHAYWLRSFFPKSNMIQGSIDIYRLFSLVSDINTKEKP